jgi:hypothetical protein
MFKETDYLMLQPLSKKAKELFYNGFFVSFLHSIIFLTLILSPIFLGASKEAD